jgi:GRAM domain
MKIDLKPNEQVVKAEDSKYLNGAVVKGKLILTNQRIYFKPSEEVDPKYDFEIEPAQIREVIPFKTGLFSNRGLNIVVKTGKEINFEVRDRDAWCKLINKMY